MKTNINKYRRKLAAIFLIAYIFFIGLTVIHYHHIDLQNGNFKIVNNDGDESNPFDKIIDLTHECTVQQFANTVINYNFFPAISLINNTSFQDFSNDEILIFPSNLHYNSNPLRAPPSIL